MSRKRTSDRNAFGPAFYLFNQRNVIQRTRVPFPARNVKRGKGARAAQRLANFKRIAKERDRDL